MFAKVLIANRGEIAVRIARACRELGVATVAVYSDEDRATEHVRVADEAFRIGPGPSSESYLVADAILDVAERSHADAIHPGYGFLAENARFAEACEVRGMTWIGPPPAAIDAMGSKVEARRTMTAAGVPVVPGSPDAVDTLEDALAAALEIGYPVAVKAAAGGGGKGFRPALDESELAKAFEGARREAERFFGDTVVYLERYLPDPRHVEIQIFADAHGNVVHLGERDCTIQRRHQKLIEESPSPAVTPKIRAEMGAMAIAAARAVDYVGAGTVECLFQDGEYFFLEMNTRIQVEHPVTELVTGIDLVAEQIRVAAGEQLSFSQDEVIAGTRGHALECRINAEDATRNFAPSPGPLSAYEEPQGPWTRVDSGIAAGGEVSRLYDPMVAKLVVWGRDREEARRRMLRALAEYRIEGISTLIPFHRWMLVQEEFVAGGTCRGLMDPALLKASIGTTVAGSQVGAPDRLPTEYLVEVGGKRLEIRVFAPARDSAPDGEATATRRPTRTTSRSAANDGGSGEVVCPMQGTVLTLNVAIGDEVEAGTVVAVVEAMKMENDITAPRAGNVATVATEVGASVQAGQVIATLARSS